MKKLFCFVLFVFVTVTSVSFNRYLLRIEKIIYEDRECVGWENYSEIEEKINDYDGINLLVKFKRKLFLYDSFDDNRIYNDNDIEEYKIAKRRAAKNYYYKYNLDNFTKLNIEKNYEYHYISMYSPYVELFYDNNMYVKNNYEILRRLSTNELIENITIEDGSEEISKMLINSASQAGAYPDVYPYGEDRGEGIRIGLLDVGIVDEDHANLDNSNLVVRDEWYFSETVSEHATKMASIIAGEYGIANSATLYSVQLAGNMVSEMDWLIDNNVDVVNMSIGIGDDNGVYDSNSAYADYIVYEYDLCIVTSAGNLGDTSEPYITSPGMGYNVITVGNSFNTYVTSSSSYQEISGPQKPTITARGCNINVPYITGFVNGTSASCAVTTGYIAILMQNYAILRINPERVIVLLCANANNLSGYNYSESNGFNEYMGAGDLRYDYAEDGINTSTQLETNVYNYGFIHDSTVYIEAGSRIRMCFVILAEADGTPSHTKMSDYILELSFSYDYDFLILSLATSENVELRVHPNVQETDTYHIRIYLSNYKETEGPGKLAWGYRFY